VKNLIVENHYKMINKSLELPSLYLMPESKKSLGQSPKVSKACEKCLKHSCVCGEMHRSPKLKLRSRLSPNNFKRHLPDIEKYRNPGMGCVITPSISSTSKSYVSYSKKKILHDSSQVSLTSSSFSLARLKQQSPKVLFNSTLIKKFQKEGMMKEKIVRIGIRYLSDPETRYQRKKLIELLYNLIQKGEKGDYACSVKRKIEEIAGFLVKHNNDLDFENFLIRDCEKEEKFEKRFDEFLKAFSSGIIR
jgi:hypothetical protein